MNAAIAEGTWQDWLPSERSLCESLQVSRNTLRGALQQLQRDGVIEARHGAGNHIVDRPADSRKVSRLRSRDVALLLPDPLEQQRPTQILWIDELRSLLNERGCRLRIFHGRQYFRRNPGAALQRLVSQTPHGCWVLALSNEAVQGWFEQSRVPCIVAGSIYAGIDLPFRDLDHRAMCRHAAGTLLRLGHRRVAFLIQKSRRAGDLESEEGFMEGITQSRYPEADARLVHHDATPENITMAVKRLLEQRQPPTALLVANPYHYLSVAGRLLQMKRAIPDEIALISRDEDPFMAFVVPTPARYVATAHALAKSLLRPVLELLEGTGVSQRSIRIMPDFFAGASLGGR